MAWELSAFTDEAGATTQEQIEAATANGLKWIDPRGIDGFNISQLPLPEAREKLLEQAQQSADVSAMLEFLDHSERALAR